MTAIDGEPDSPRQEFWVSVVGPLSSLAVALVAFLAYLVAPGGLIGLALSGLAWTNLFVGIINLVPGLPLDGGRILKALVWGASGDTHRGTIVAAWGGRIVALLALGYPFLTAKFFGQADRHRLRLRRRHLDLPVERRQPGARVRAGALPACPTSWPATWPVVPSPSPATCRWPRPYAARRRRRRAAS